MVSCVRFMMASGKRSPQWLDLTALRNHAGRIPTGVRKEADETG